MPVSKTLPLSKALQRAALSMQVCEPVSEPVKEQFRERPKSEAVKALFIVAFAVICMPPPKK
jgi:hypothetical protein